MRIAVYIVEILLGDPERLHAAAIRFPDGNVIEGSFHVDCWHNAFEAGLTDEAPGGDNCVVELCAKYGAEEGFTTTSGRFVSREEADKIAVEAGQKEAPSDYGYLDADDVNL